MTISGEESKFSMEKHVKILIVGINSSIMILTIIWYSPYLEVACQNWSSALFNKEYTLNAQFESLYKTDPSMLEQSWKDATFEWMTYQRELHGYEGPRYMFVNSEFIAIGDLTGANDLNNDGQKIINFSLGRLTQTSSVLPASLQPCKKPS